MRRAKCRCDSAHSVHENTKLLDERSCVVNGRFLFFPGGVRYSPGKMCPDLVREPRVATASVHRP